MLIICQIIAGTGIHGKKETKPLPSGGSEVIEVEEQSSSRICWDGDVL